jgi:uncharacterized membrane protein
MRRWAVVAFLNILVTLCIGLLVGTELAVSAFVNPVLWRLDESAQPQAIAFFARRLGMAMPFWYGVSFLLLLAETSAHWRQAGLALLGAASGVWAATIVLTVFFLVPINKGMARLDRTSFTADARRDHRRWDAMHRVRVGALCAAWICFLIAVHR